MKKVLLSLFTITLITGSLKAQIGKGSLWLGGSIGYNKSKAKTNSPSESKVFIVSPSIGTAIKENLVAGIKLSYFENSSSLNSSGSYYNDKYRQYGGGVFVRQYIPIVTRLYIFGEGDATFTAFKRNTDPYSGSNTYNKGWTGALSFYPGVSFTLTNKLQIETGFSNLLSVQYTNGKNTDQYSGTAVKSNNFSAGLSLENGAAFTLGFRLLLNNKS